jgi:hypothetical protein
MVVSVAVNVGRISRRGKVERGERKRTAERVESGLDDAKTGGLPLLRDQLGDALRLPKRHPAWRRREAQPGSRKKLTCSGHAANSRRYRDLGSTCLCRGREWLDLNGVAKVGQAFD